MTGPRDGGEDARHVHTEVTVEVVEQKAGVPYTVRTTTCAACGAILSRTRVRRATA